MFDRVVIHPGFHKTGTTTLQTLLRENAATLAPFLTCMFEPALRTACKAARGYSTTGSALDLGLIQYELSEALQSLTPSTKTLVVSCEDLCGHLPGRRNVTSYSAAPALMRAAAEVFDVLMPDADVMFFFTTRAPRAWLKSCYAQHLRVIRMVQDEDTYAEDYSLSSQLDKIVDAVAKELPNHRILRAALEDYSTCPIGPLKALLDCADVPPQVQDTLRLVPNKNVAPPPDTMAKLLDLNRSTLDDDALRMAKKALKSKRF